jgi:hypothetical protein
MKKLRKELQSVLKNLKALSQKTEKLSKEVDKLAKKGPAKKFVVKRKAKTAAKRVAKRAKIKPQKKTSAIDTVLQLIQKRKRGMRTAEIKALTGYGDKKIWDIVNRAKRQGKVKSTSKGLYVRA